MKKNIKIIVFINCFDYFYIQTFIKNNETLNTHNNIKKKQTNISNKSVKVI